MATVYHGIDIRSPNGVLLSHVGVYRNAKYTRLVNDVGDFSLEFPIDQPVTLAAAVYGNHVEFTSTLNGVVSIAFGGVIVTREIKQEDPVSWVTVSGPSWIGLMQRRIVDATGGAYDVYTNVRADDLLKRLVSKHCGPTAASGRPLPYFEVAAESSVYATFTNYNGRYEVVLEAL